MINKLTSIMLLLNLLIVFYVGFLAFYPFKTVSVDQPYLLHETKLHAGDFITYTFDYCRFTDGDVDIQHQLIGDVSVRIVGQITFELEDAGLRLHEGCNTATKGVPIPDNIPEGVYFLEENLVYQVSPLQTRSETFRTELFEIIKQ